MSRFIKRSLAATMLAGAGVLLMASPASAVSETCAPFLSDGLELKICATLGTPSAGTAEAGGRTIELHEYRRDHVITVELQRRDGSGVWTTVAAARGRDFEGASAVTDAVAVSGAVRSCATGGLVGHEQATVCTA